MKLTILLIMGLFVVYGFSVVVAIGWMKFRQWFRMRKEFCVYTRDTRYPDEVYNSECGYSFYKAKARCRHCNRRIIVKGE